MIRAILEGKKSQTRRLVKPQWQSLPLGIIAKCPHGVAGDRLWVRETWGFDSTIRHDFKPLLGQHDLSGRDLREALVYRADIPAVSEADERSVRRMVKGVAPPWRPSIHMPRWASRITLEVTSVRVERLQDITEDDARAEGFEYREHFFKLWGEINGEGNWLSDPWVWRISFVRAA